MASLAPFETEDMSPQERAQCRYREKLAIAHSELLTALYGLGLSHVGNAFRSVCLLEQVDAIFELRARDRVQLEAIVSGQRRLANLPEASSSALSLDGWQPLFRVPPAFNAEGETPLLAGENERELDVAAETFVKISEVARNSLKRARAFQERDETETSM